MIRSRFTPRPPVRVGGLGVTIDPQIRTADAMEHIAKRLDDLVQAAEEIAVVLRERP